MIFLLIFVFLLGLALAWADTGDFSYIAGFIMLIFSMVGICVLVASALAVTRGGEAELQATIDSTEACILYTQALEDYLYYVEQVQDAEEASNLMTWPFAQTEYTPYIYSDQEIQARTDELC